MLELKEIEGQDYGKDLVEVVRCKNCAYSEGMESSRYVMCLQFMQITHINDFCSCAERKRDDKT